MTRIKQETRLPYRTLCTAETVPYSTLMRWQSRVRRGQPVVERPGPKKVEPLDGSALRRRVAELQPGRRRTRGSGALYRELCPHVSRRELAQAVVQARQEANASFCRIEWRVVNLAWSMDDTQLNGKQYLHHLQDLASRFKFPPLVGPFPAGEAVADHLQELFRGFGPPLFLKRDNGSNLNHAAVGELLAQYGVLPLNSPPYYPRYNGAMERAQGELKSQLPSDGENRSVTCAETLAAIHELNHQARRALNGANACQLFFTNRHKARFTKRQRKEIYEELIELSSGILVATGATRLADQKAAWRIAVERWLVKHHYITVTRGHRVLPPLSEKRSHN